MRRWLQTLRFSMGKEAAASWQPLALVCGLQPAQRAAPAWSQGAGPGLREATSPRGRSWVRLCWSHSGQRGTSPAAWQSCRSHSKSRVQFLKYVFSPLEVSMKTPAFVHAAACEPLLLTPRSAKPAAPTWSAPHPAKATAPKPA